MRKYRISRIEIDSKTDHDATFMRMGSEGGAATKLIMCIKINGY